MNFATDRDLLSLEPDVFTEVPLVGQQRIHVTDAQLDGTTLTSLEADFAAADIETGAVALLGRTPLEVVQRIDANTLTVSLLRSHTTDPPVPPTGFDDPALTLSVRTFAPQATLVHDALLRLLGIDPDGIAPDALTEDAVVLLGVMSRLEALGTLERVYASAAVIENDAPLLARKAAHYRRRFDQARQTAVVMLDVNGDGLPEERRSLGVIRMTRA